MARMLCMIIVLKKEIMMNDEKWKQVNDSTPAGAIELLKRPAKSGATRLTHLADRSPHDSSLTGNSSEGHNLLVNLYI